MTKPMVDETGQGCEYEDHANFDAHGGGFPAYDSAGQGDEK